MRVLKPNFTPSREDAEKFVDEALALAHEEGGEFERKMFDLVYRITQSSMDKFLKLLSIFSEELGSLLYYVRAFALEREQYRALMH